MSFIIFTNIKECIILTSFVNIVLSSPDLVYLNALLHKLNNCIFFIKIIKVKINGGIAQVMILP